MSMNDEIESRGFLHQEAFLDKFEIESLRQTLASPAGHGARRLNIDSVPRALMEKIDATAKSCFPHHDLRPIGATCIDIHRSDSAQSEDFEWHQDHEYYFQYRQHYHCLNFWIVLAKDDPLHSNLSIVPFDRLLAENVKLHDVAYRSGATTYGRGKVVRAVTASTMRHECDLDSLARMPSLSAGDLLLLRGDAIHRMQDPLSDCLAVSFQYIDFGHVLDRNNFYPLSLPHLKFAQNNLKDYAQKSYVFKVLKADYVSVKDFQGCLNRTTENGASARSKEFLSFAQDYNQAIRHRLQIATLLARNEPLRG